MKTKKRVTLFIILVLLTLLVITFLSSCGQSSDSSNGEIKTLSDLDGLRIGSLVGSTCLDDAESLAGKDGEALGFNSTADLPQALLSNKIDAYVIDGSLTMKTLKEHPELKKIDESIRPIQYGFIFPKTGEKEEGLLSQMNEFLKKMEADGEIDAIWDKWTDPDDSGKTIDYSGITGKNGTLTIATYSSAGEPSVYIKDGELAGADIDFAVRFCTEYGYTPEFSDLDFSGVIAGITTGKYMMGASSITITEERAESVNFSYPYYDGGIDVIVKGADSTSEGFVSSISTAFTRTFIDEGRWKLFARGGLTTLIISLCALIAGTLLGFVVFVFCRNGGRIRNRITDACIFIVSGMPAVVLLMILFYIAFAAISIGGVAVSAIAFTIIFAAATVGMLRTGLSAIDKGQDEAGRSLGYTEYQTFKKIILPQIIRITLPSYQSEAKELLKGTAIVGYIAVRDLTKAGDIVRSATYDAIFPLIAVALSYFVLEILIKYVISGIDTFCFERKSGSSIVKNLELTNPEKLHVGSDSDQEVLNHIKGSISETFNSWKKNNVNGEEPPEEIIRFEHVNKSYGDTEVLSDVNAVIYEKEIVGVIGPSGCGKSTLLSCLNSLDPPTSGRIIADGMEITDRKCRSSDIHKLIGTVFQRWNLFNHWTVMENLMRPQIDIRGLSRQEAYNRAVRALVAFGLHDKGDSYADELSGGQQQRIAIIRTLLLEPRIVVLDEPTSALDPYMVGEVKLVLSYFAEKGTTLLIVSHDMTFLSDVCSRILYLDEKAIYEDGTPEEILEAPKRPLTRAFIRQAKYRAIDITSKKNDIAGLLSEIDAFCIENRISKRINNRMITLFIALAMQIIIPEMEDEFELTVFPVYSEKPNQVNLVFFYTGKQFNPEDTARKDLWQEVLSEIKDFRYSPTDEMGYTNWATCEIRD